MRSNRRLRSDAEILAHDRDMQLLDAIADGRVVRGISGRDTSLLAPTLLDGISVGLRIRWLANEDLVRAPISGPPVLEARGARLLALRREQG